MIKQLPCPHCKQSWIFVDQRGYGSDYKSIVYQGSCKCRRFNKLVNWHKEKEQAIEEWNNIIKIDTKSVKH